MEYFSYEENQRENQSSYADHILAAGFEKKDKGKNQPEGVCDEISVALFPEIDYERHGVAEREDQEAKEAQEEKKSLRQ